MNTLKQEELDQLQQVVVIITITVAKVARKQQLTITIPKPKMVVVEKEEVQEVDVKLICNEIQMEEAEVVETVTVDEEAKEVEDYGMADGNQHLELYQDRRHPIHQLPIHYQYKGRIRIQKLLHCHGLIRLHIILQLKMRVSCFVTVYSYHSFAFHILCLSCVCSSMLTHLMSSV